ncbi:recombinase family protein [Jatrophihabitans fulvus]
MTDQKRRAVVYARLSVSQDESVSIDRQIEACSKYADARGWEVVAVRKDDGVSATHNRPEDRAGWGEVLSLDAPYDVVIVWKLDRLARRITDFWRAVEALEERGTAVAVVTENFDLTTSIGKIVAGVLAGFAQMEAEAISARVAGARDHLIRNGRVVGGTVPYGYAKAANPSGKGFVLVQDEATIGYVREAAERALRRETVYSIKQWLSAEAPLPTKSQATRKREGWAYSTVERMLRNPILAGMIAHNPDNRTKVRGAEVLRDEQGLPVVYKDLAVITTDERRRLLALLDDEGDRPQRRPRAGRGTTSPLLSRLVSCGECDRTMHRGTSAGRPAVMCPECYQTISTDQLTAHIEARLLAERGDELAVDATVTATDNSAALADLEEAIADVSAKLTRDDADVPKLVEQLAGLKELRARARDDQPKVRHYEVHESPVRDEWAAATSDEERRTVLLSQLSSLRIVRGKVGRYLDPARVVIEWRPSNLAGDAMAELFSNMQPGDTYSTNAR